MKKYPHAPGYKSRFPGLFREHVHGETRDLGLLLLAWKQGISEEVAAATNLNASFVHRFSRKMSSGTGTSREWCDWAVTMWCVCYGERVLHKNCDLEILRDTAEGPASLAEEQTGVAAGVNAAAMFTCETQGGTRIITGYQGAVGKTLVIPNEYGKMPVRRIAAGAFRGCTAVHVLLPDTVQEIGDEAFADCRELQQAVLPASLRRIGARSFRRCRKLRAVKLPEDLEGIGTEAFAGTGIHLVTVPDTVTELGAGVFEDCSALIEAEIGLGIIELPPRTFRDCTALEDVTLPVTLDRIGAQAFEGCSALPDMQLPDNVKYIGDAAFAYTHPHFRLVGRRGSVVEYYCKKHHMPCVLIR